MTTIMDTQPHSQLARLPAEVLGHITRWVSTTDYSAVRRTCKMLERKTFQQWTHEFFRKKQFMVSTVSLDTLVDIAKHPHIGPVLRHLVLCTDSIPPPVLRSAVIEDITPQDRAKLDAYDDQFWLLSTGLWIRKLTEGMALLPNLQTIDLRDFNSRTRFRDGPEAAWQSYGAGTYYQESGQKTTMVENIGRIYQGAIVAIAESGVTPPNFEVIMRGPISDQTLYIPPDLVPRLTPFFSNLRKFHIVGGSGALVMPNLQKLIAMASNVTWLRINLTLFDATLSSEEFWQWFSGPPTFSSRGVHSPTLPNLETLDIGFSHIKHEVLSAIPAKYKLRTLTLWKTVLVDAPYVPRNRTPEEPENLWLPVLRSFTGSSIKRLTIGECGQYGFNTDGDEVYRSTIEFPSIPRESQRRHLILPSGVYTNKDVFAQVADDMKMSTEFHAVHDNGIPPWPGNFETDDEEGEDDEDGGGGGDGDDGNGDGNDGNGDGNGDGNAVNEDEAGE